MGAARSQPGNVRKGRAPRVAGPCPVSRAEAILEAAVAPLRGTTIALDARLMQRGVADIVEAWVCEAVARAAAAGTGVGSAPAPTKRSMEDVTLTLGTATVRVDVKTHDLAGKFSMPNVVSIERLARFYASADNTLVVLFVRYDRVLGGVALREVSWSTIERICWTSLTIGNLGNGQLQIRDARKALGRFTGDRAAWMRRLCLEAAGFHADRARKAAASGQAWTARLARSVEEAA